MPSTPTTLSHQPARIPPILAFRGNPLRQLFQFSPARPTGITADLMLANRASAGAMNPPPVLTLVGANGLLVEVPDTAQLPDRLFLALSWGGAVRLAGEIQVGRGLKVSGGLPALTVDVQDPEVVEVEVTELLLQSGNGQSVGQSVTGETPSGAINGSNATFLALSDFVPASLEVFVTGLRLTYGDDYTTSGPRTINMSVSPKSGEQIRINYLKPL